MECAVQLYLKKQCIDLTFKVPYLKTLSIGVFSDCSFMLEDLT